MSDVMQESWKEHAIRIRTIPVRKIVTRAAETQRDAVWYALKLIDHDVLGAVGGQGALAT